MNKIQLVKDNFGIFYRDRGFEGGVLQGNKYHGSHTHCRACLNTLTRMFEPKSFLEIGSYHYDSSKVVSEAMDEYLTEDEGVIHTFDIKLGGYDGLGMTVSLPKRVKPMFWYPWKTNYDPFKLTDPLVVFKEFQEMSDVEVSTKNLEILKRVAPEDGYDLIFLDGDHSYEGAKHDWELVLQVAHKDTLIVIDNVWDERLSEVRRFYDGLSTTKWDFEEWNDEHESLIQDTGISLTY